MAVEITEEFVWQNIPRRARDSHKGTFGTVLAVAGSAYYRGAALLAGRAYVLPQDVKEIAPDVLRHRIVLSYEAEAENIDTDAVIQRLLAELRTP